MTKVICACKQVDKETIVNAIYDGACSVEEVGTRTKAGTGCGSCQWTLEQMVLSKKRSENRTQ